MDGLTGMANRRYFDEFLHEEWRRGTRLNLPISLILLDIDHFKAFNDHYGHQAGDECLRQIGNVLKLYSTRPDDLAARYGGEEFTVILGNTSLENAMIVANYIHKAITDLAIPHAYSDTASIVTASIGVASMQPVMQSAKVHEETALIDAADKGLYSAKEHGRNQVFGTNV
jgi:diguanylate cyclase (GGDEF)-like protein